jgi:hypothetical protein
MLSDNYSYVTVPFMSSHLYCRRLQEVRKSTHPDGLTSDVDYEGTIISSVFHALDNHCECHGKITRGIRWQ